MARTSGGPALWPQPDIPTVDHYGPGVGGVEGLHFLQELQHPDGGERHSEVGPAGEVQLGDEPRGFAALGELLRGTGGHMSRGTEPTPFPNITF